MSSVLVVDVVLDIEVFMQIPWLFTKHSIKNAHLFISKY